MKPRGLGGTACSRRLILSWGDPATRVSILGSRKLGAVSSNPPPGPSPAQLGGYSRPGAQTNSLAVISLVTGVGSFLGHIVPFIGGGTLALIAIVTGFMARGQIKQTGEQGRWLANVGIVIGVIHLAGPFPGPPFFLFLVFVPAIALLGGAPRNGSA